MFQVLWLNLGNKSSDSLYETILQNSCKSPAKLKC